MATNTHINKWIKRAELDYYTMFIKTWIPFNAWYMRDFYDDSITPPRTSDKAIIDYLNSNSNKYRDKIKRLLRGTDDVAKEFSHASSLLMSGDSRVMTRCLFKAGGPDCWRGDRMLQSGGGDLQGAVRFEVLHGGA